MNISRWVRGKRIAVVCGGASAEREISRLSGAAVERALRGAGARVVVIESGPDLPARLARLKPAFVYLALHGPGGEDGTVQGMLEVMGIPYSGCGVLSSALAMDKDAAKRMLFSAGLPTPSWNIVVKGATPRPAVPGYPCVVKPVDQGSAIGVSIVKKAAQLPAALQRAFCLSPRVMVERYIKGTEITVGVLGGRALPSVEIVPKNAFYDFDAKYTAGRSAHIIPPRLGRAVLSRAARYAERAAAVCSCRAVVRVDMIVDPRGKPWILELNTIPGMTETSLLPDEARAAGMNFTELVLAIIRHSLER